MTTKFFTSTPARANLPVGEDHEVYAIFTFTTPEMDNSARPPLDIAVAMDVSGSMSSDNKMGMAKKSLLKLVEHLTDKDRLSIVTFDSSVSTAFEPDTMTSSAKGTAQERIKAMFPGSMTNLSGGILQALSFLTQETPAEGTLQRCLAFTDGQANVGISDPKTLAEAVGEMRSGRTLSTFGYGRDHNADLLAQIAQDGNFHYIDTPDKILTAFGLELGGLISTYAQNVRLTLSPSEGVEIVEVLNDLTVKPQDDGSALIEVDDLLAGQDYSVAVRLKITSRDSHGPRALKMVSASVSYFNVADKKQSSTTSNLKVRFVQKGKEDTEDDKKVMEEVAFQKSIQAQAQAINYAEAGDFDNARLVLQESASFSDGVGTAKSTAFGDLARGLVAENYLDQHSYAASAGETRALRSAMSRKRGATLTKGGVDLTMALGNDAQVATSQAFAAGSGDSNAEVIVLNEAEPAADSNPPTSSSSLGKTRSDRW